jgi:hypothetical protein
MTPEIIKEEAGRYALIKKDERYYASVLCGTSAMYTLNIPITSDQAREVLGNESLLDQLVGEIAFAPNRYLSQHVDLHA